MTEPDRERMRQEDHITLGKVFELANTLLRGQTDHQRATAERQQRQDDKIERLAVEMTQQNREMVRAGKETAELRGELREMRQAMDQRLDQLGRTVETAAKGGILPATAIATIIGTIIVAIIQFVVPRFIP